MKTENPCSEFLRRQSARSAMSIEEYESQMAALGQQAFKSSFHSTPVQEANERHHVAGVLLGVAPSLSR